MHLTQLVLRTLNLRNNFPKTNKIWKHGDRAQRTKADLKFKRGSFRKAKTPVLINCFVSAEGFQGIGKV